MHNKSALLVILIEAYVPLPYEHLHDHHEAVHISLITVNFDLKQLLDVIIDENTLSYYLIGYSRLKGSSGDFESHSFKLSRIIECRSKHKAAKLSDTEIKTIKDINDKFGSAYIPRNLIKKDIEKTIVRLTKNGYENLYLRIISHQRPIPVTPPKQISLEGEDYYDLTFDCSYQHIRNYFFSFGAEAEVISPLWLRDRFMNDYKKSIERYSSD